MRELKAVFASLDISTRPKRRKAVDMIITELQKICEHEEVYIERIPLNMQGGEAYSNAEDSISILTDAVDLLIEAYY